jgi:hypothetical protein
MASKVRGKKKHVFISHSFADKWVATHIASDLESRGVSCFLAEKDVNTGAEIVASVRKQLAASDELLIILSPASVQSYWVQAEIAMAIALEKPFAPILLHVGTNDVPRLLAPYNARDINAIERYYAELAAGTRDAIVAKTTKRTQAAKKPRRQGTPRTRFAVGDSVKIVEAPQEDIYRPGKGMLNWAKGFMDVFAGRTAKITEVDRDGSAKLDVDDGVFWWAFEWLKKQ